MILPLLWNVPLLFLLYAVPHVLVLFSSVLLRGTVTLTSIPYLPFPSLIFDLRKTFSAFLFSELEINISAPPFTSTRT